MLKGSLIWFNRKDIHKFDHTFDLYILNEQRLYDLLEEQILAMGYETFDEDFEFIRELIVSGYHIRRYSCMELKGVRRNGRFILKEAGIQVKKVHE